MAFLIRAIFCLGLAGIHWQGARGHEFCSDFNDAASRASTAGLEHVYKCEPTELVIMKGSTYDGKCTTPFPMKPVEQIHPSNISWNDIAIMSIYGGSRSNILLWWLQFFEPSPDTYLDFVIFENACPSTGSEITSDSTSFVVKDELDACEGDTARLATTLKERFPFVRLHVVRGLQWDAGKHRIACKMLTGMIKSFRLLPHKRFYVQIDDDTVLFPKRLLRLIHTADATTPADKPLYIGTVLNDHRPFGLCGDFAGADVCCAQGGAGYVLNHEALAAFNRSVTNWPCKQSEGLEREDGDAYIAVRLYKEFQLRTDFVVNATLLHCGGFRPHGGSSADHFRHAVSFHHIDDRWIENIDAPHLVDNYGADLTSHSPG